jgi:hypothetical protein
MAGSHALSMFSNLPDWYPDLGLSENKITLKLTEEKIKPHSVFGNGV